MPGVRNFAVSTIATAPSPATSGTTFSFAASEGARFPPVPYQLVRWPADATPTPANAEVVTITAQSGDNVTAMTRAREGSTAQTWAVGDRIAATLTADLWNSLVQYPASDYGTLGAADDAATINAAITAANAAGGGVVTLPAGTYTAGTITPKANVQLRGRGRHSTVLKLRDTANANLLVASAAHRFVLADMTIDGNKANNVGAGNWIPLFLSLSDGVVVENVRVINADNDGLAFAGCKHGLVFNCSVEDSGYIGIWLGVSGVTHCTGFRIIATQIYRSVLDAIIIDCDDVAVESCWLEDNGIGKATGGPGASGVYVGQLRRRIRVEDNSIIGTTNYGIDFDTSTTDASYGAVVVGNVSIENDNAGIGCGSAGALITGNTCLNNGQDAASPYRYGIVLDAPNITASNNTCIDTQGSPTQTYGIALRNLSGVTTALTITGNKLAGNVNAGILNLTTIGANHHIWGNTGVDESTVRKVGLGVMDPGYQLHIRSSANDHLRLQRGTAGQVYSSYIDGSRTWTFEKSAGGAVGSSLNTRFYFSGLGGIDSITPYWSGFFWGGHTVTEGGTGRFPNASFFSRSSVAADPTDYEFLFAAGNSGNLPCGIGFGAFNIATSSIRFGFGNASISAEAFRAYYDGTNTFVGIGVTAPTHKLQLNTGTVITDIRAVDVTTTWNEANTDFEAMRVSVGNTASGSGARIANFLVGGSSVASIEKDGTVVSTAALRTQHVGTTTPTGGASGDIKVGALRIWLNDANVWRTFTQDGLYSAIAPVTIASSVTETSLGTFTIPANFLRAGTSLRLTAGGVMGTHTAGTPAPTWRVRIGAVGSVLTGNIISTIAVVSTSSLTNKGWQADFIVTCRTAGAAGTIIGNGVCANEISAVAPNDNKLSAVTATVAVDTTVQRDIAMTFQWGASNASNTLTAHNVCYDVAVA